MCSSKTGYTVGVNQPLKAIARNGRLIMDVPTDLPDGKEVEVVIVSDEINFAESWMDETEAKEFRQEVCASMADHEAGRVIEGAELIAELRARHAS